MRISDWSSDVCSSDLVAMLAAFEHCTERGWAADGVIAQGEGQAAQLWRLREGITESLARHEPYKNDVSVRVSAMPAFLAEAQRSAERRVGKECVRTCRSRGAPYHEKKKKQPTQ